MSQPVGDLIIDLSLDAVRFDEQMSRVRRHFSGLDTDARKTATAVEQGLSRQALAAQKAGISVGQYKAAMRTLPAQFTDIATQLAGGQNPWLILLQQGGQVKDSFGGMIPMFRGLAGAITLPMVGVTSLAVATGALAYAWYQGDSTLSAFNKTLVLSGNQSGLTADRMLTLSRAGQAAGLTFNQARESLASEQEKSLLTHEKETLEYKRQLAELGDKVEHQKRLNELAQQAARFEQQQGAKQAAISAQARGLTDRQVQRESEEQRLRDVYGDNPDALAKATSALKNTWSAEEQLRGSWMAGLKSGWGEWAESATDSFSQVKSVATQTFDGIAQNMAAMLTGSEQSWRGFTRSVLSMLTEIFLKQAMVGIVGSIGSAMGGAFGGGASASTGTAIQAAAANFHFATGGFTGTGGKYEPAGIVHRGEFVFTKEATSRIGVGNLYRLMRGYAEGGYVGGAGSPAQMRRAEGISFNQNNHVVIQNDGTNGQAGPQLMKAVYDMARKGAQDEIQAQMRDGGVFSGGRR
ncbi:TPA: phage tail tape measure protein [Escherichia coli]|nr:phage tail tape measure protein [Escherichia coli]HCP2896506.1 phage tail tape measure protein [Escherichia coli]HCP4547930.1 phage tail tape measure protein [Escherichia coli]